MAGAPFNNMDEIYSQHLLVITSITKYKMNIFIHIQIEMTYPFTTSTAASLKLWTDNSSHDFLGIWGDDLRLMIEWEAQWINSEATIDIVCHTEPIPCLLMHWRIQEPVHQKAWHWPKTGIFRLQDLKELNSPYWATYIWLDPWADVITWFKPSDKGKE